VNQFPVSAPCIPPPKVLSYAPSPSNQEAGHRLAVWSQESCERAPEFRICFRRLWSSIRWMCWSHCFCTYKVSFQVPLFLRILPATCRNIVTAFSSTFSSSDCPTFATIKKGLRKQPCLKQIWFQSRACSHIICQGVLNQNGGIVPVPKVHLLKILDMRWVRQDTEDMRLTTVWVNKRLQI
jgi:hypothetical protein